MKLVFLGTAQDAGIPQINCYCDLCQAAKRGTIKHRLGPSIAIVNEQKGSIYIFDASPDLKVQVDFLQTNFLLKPTDTKHFPISSFFLTHAHFGHVAGLWLLGKESMNAHEILIYCSEELATFLATHHPFHHLQQEKNILVHSLEKNCQHSFEGFTIELFSVPHRNEYADTVGYLISFPAKKLLYLPDIDFWTEDILAKINEIDIAIIDGTFFSDNEISDYRSVPHPPIEQTIKKLVVKKENEIYFTHFNHTNPIVKKGSPEYQKVVEQGFKIATDGLILEL
ncbi:MAG: hypothetical protein K9W42_13505 [Candidatus Heimdallarchaeota archaeon]|nr:hypothetical protein [Candidatus Heimdallarchaeota archaeon]